MPFVFAVSGLGPNRRLEGLLGATGPGVTMFGVELGPTSFEARHRNARKFAPSRPEAADAVGKPEEPGMRPDELKG